MCKYWLPLAILLAAAAPAHAAEIEKNEPLVVRLIFDDCLGYVRHDRTPFNGLPHQPARAAVLKYVPRLMPGRDQAIELISPRYVAVWDADANGRYCSVQQAAHADDTMPARLGVHADSFMRQLDARAAQERLAAEDNGTTFSALSISKWSGPDTGDPYGPLRPLSVVAIGTSSTDGRGVLDAGLFIVVGPVQVQP